MSAETVSAITDRVWEDLERWRSRPLEPVTPSCSSTASTCPCRTAAARATPPCTRCWPTTCAAAKGRPGPVDGRLRGRPPLDAGVRRAQGPRRRDVLYVSSDGVAGLGEGLGAVFPAATHQRCIVHLVRNSLGYVPQKEAAAFCRSIRAVYGAPSLAACRVGLGGLPREWSRYPGAVAVWERSLDQVWQLSSPAARRSGASCTRRTPSSRSTPVSARS